MISLWHEAIYLYGERVLRDFTQPTYFWSSFFIKIISVLPSSRQKRKMISETRKPDRPGSTINRVKWLQHGFDLMEENRIYLEFIRGGISTTLDSLNASSQPTTSSVSGAACTVQTPRYENCLVLQGPQIAPQPCGVWRFIREGRAPNLNHSNYQL